MNVRMVDERIASPGLQYTEEPELTVPERPRRRAHVADRLGARIEQAPIAVGL